MRGKLIVTEDYFGKMFMTMNISLLINDSKCAIIAKYYSIFYHPVFNAVAKMTVHLNSDNI